MCHCVHACLCVCVFVCVCVAVPPPQKELMLSNGCYNTPFNVSDCMSVQEGLFSHGLHAVVTYYVNTAQDAVMQRIVGPNVNATMAVRPPCACVCRVCVPVPMM